VAIIETHSSQRLLTYFYVVPLLLVGESVAAIFVDVRLPSGLLGMLYPQLSTLQAYCGDNPCIYDASRVATLYGLQLLTLAAASALIAPDALSSKVPLQKELAFFLCIVVFGALFDYLNGNFSFDPAWRAPNSVTDSPLGLFRYAVLFSMAGFAIAVMAGGGSAQPPNFDRTRSG
jgi:hypothetical protein